MKILSSYFVKFQLYSFLEEIGPFQGHPISNKDSFQASTGCQRAPFPQNPVMTLKFKVENERLNDPGR